MWIMVLDVFPSSNFRIKIMFYIYIIANVMYLVYVVFYRTKIYFKIFPYACDYRINSN